MFVRMEGAMSVHKVTRVWELAHEAGLMSHQVVLVLRSLGYPVRSPSSRLDLEPLERESLLALLTT
jgi:hypothetical protein